MNDRKVFYIEKLTICSWLFFIFPYFLKQSLKVSLSLYYIDASWLGLKLAQGMSPTIRAEVRRLDFTLFDSKDSQGDLLWWKVAFEDLVEIQKYMMTHLAFQDLLKKYRTQKHLLLFLMRRILYFDLSPFGLTRILLLIRLASCRLNSQGPVTMFLSSGQRPWLAQVGKWAIQKQDVAIIPMRGIGFDCNIARIVAQSGPVKSFIKKMMYHGMKIKYRMCTIFQKSLMDIAINNPSKDSSPKIAVEFYGHLNLSSPYLNSDLFFYQNSTIASKDILIYFQHTRFPVSDKELEEILSCGMSAVVLNTRAARTPRAPIFNYHSPKVKVDSHPSSTMNQDEAAIQEDLCKQLGDYDQQRRYWAHFFARYNIKMHVSWYKYESGYLPLADALRQGGGVGVIYQRSFEMASNPWTVTAADVVFGFSKLGAHLGHDVDSLIPYYVVTGYWGEYRFAGIRKEAENFKTRLRAAGAQKIIAYFDESSVDDDRWNIGHQVTQENYTYLLNKVLEKPWLGLILKPKVVSSLRKRLGNVAGLLDCALKTGRCFVFDKNNVFGSYPPAAAALAADLAIHGHFFAATAGLESALTGTPTLMLDREGYSRSPLYALGVGRVIFKNWGELWRACEDHWAYPSGVPRFGDWSSMIDELDPFRDGRAAQRMGAYLQWIMEGFKAKLPRETILSDAAERYSALWGKDKVFSINSNLKQYACVN